MVPLSTSTKGGETLPAFWEIDMLPAEEACVDGQGARPDHCQNSAEDRMYDGKP
jgi:hypothetical protein